MLTRIISIFYFFGMTLKLRLLAAATSKICTCWQDHERAFFDSADWALGKAITRLAFLFFLAYVECKSHKFTLYITDSGRGTEEQRTARGSSP